MRKIGQSSHPHPAPPPAVPAPVPVHQFHPHYAPQHHYEDYKQQYHPVPHKPEYYQPQQEYIEPKPIAYSHHPPFPQYNSFYDDSFNFPNNVESPSSAPLYSSYEQQSHLEDDYGSAGGFQDYNNYYTKRSANTQVNNKIARSPAIPVSQPHIPTETKSEPTLLEKLMEHHRKFQHLEQQKVQQSDFLLPASTKALWET